MNLNLITQPFLEKFPGDTSDNPMQRQTPKMLFATALPVHFPQHQLLTFNQNLSEAIGLGDITSAQDEDFLAAQNLPPHIKTYATAYAGHQFGNWAGQLGDGRALFAGEIKNTKGQPTELQWKGAGATPYSRFADGRAVLRSSVREFLMSEAMHHLGVPTTRALSLSETGEPVVRDILYDGHPKAEKGAIVMRTAPTFLRFGHFQLLSAQEEIETLKRLADDTILRYFPEIEVQEEQKYHQFFRVIVQKTAHLMVEWQRVGFTHGVMNTDNMSILGLTIDYGPFSMLDAYDLNFTPNTTDLPGRRYAFGRQAEMAQWNLWQLGNALFPLIKEAAWIEACLEEFATLFWKGFDEMLAQKFGLETLMPEDTSFFTQWQQMIMDLELDYTLFFNAIEDLSQAPNWNTISYKPLSTKEQQTLKQWWERYQERLSKNQNPPEQRRQMMQKVNPKFILRNYLLYECIEALNNGDTTMLHQLIDALKHPYELKYPHWAAKRPEKYNSVAGCSTLSCSS